MVITTDNKKFKIELVMTKLEIGKMLIDYKNDRTNYGSMLKAIDAYASTAKHNVSGELPSDEECKCIKYKGGNKWYSNGCKIHPDE